MEFLPMILIIFLATIPISCLGLPFYHKGRSNKVQNSTIDEGLVIPILHRDHPRIQSYFARLKPLKDDVSAPIHRINSDFIFYAVFYIGSGSTVDRIAAFDTGSTFTWIKLTQDYDPTLSSSYKNLPCNDERCNNVPSHTCEDPTQCVYNIKYGDGSTSSGYVGIDTFTFHGDDGKAAISTEVVFGSGDTGTSREVGVLGVSRYKSGILGAFQVHYFSICIPKWPKKDSYARFGTEADMDGNRTTELVPFDGRNIAFLVEYCTIGKNKVNGGMYAFDTGSSLTQLVPKVMDQVLKFVKASINAVPVDMRILELCYKTKDRQEFEDLKFVFELKGHGSSLPMEFNNLWIPYRDAHCLAFQRSIFSYNILGVTQMEGWTFGFDFMLQEMNFQKQDC